MKTLLASLLLLAAVHLSACTLSKPEPVMVDVIAAVDANDAQRLQQWVDMPAVQESLAKQYTQWLGLKMKGMGMVDWQSAQQSGLDAKMARRLVEEVITPEGLLKLIQGDQQELLGKLNADYVPEETLRMPLKNRSTARVIKRTSSQYSVCLTDNATRKPMVILHLGVVGSG